MNETELLKARLDHIEGLLNTLIKSDRYVLEKSLQFADGRNIQLGKTTGTKIGTEGYVDVTDQGQKMAFFGQTPRTQVKTADVPSTAAGIITTLKQFGFYQT